MIGGEILDATLSCSIGYSAVIGDEYSPKLDTNQDESNLSLSFLRQSNSERAELTRVTLDEPNTAYFKRVWQVSHKLDQFSNLLNSQTRNDIRREGGYWPMHLYSHEHIRASIVPFEKLILTLSGTCRGHSVFAQHVYYFDEIKIGYVFVEMADISCKEIYIDFSKINVVKEQFGGGREPLMDV